MTGTATRRLILLRHAKAEPSGGRDDALRPLALEGRRQAGRVGSALRESDLTPGRVLCSSALRARQTWELASARLGEPGPEVVVDEELYLADVGGVLDLLHGTPSSVHTLLVVGHEPTMAATAAHLADTRASESGAVAQVRVGVPTATYSVLECDAPWDEWSVGGVVLSAVRRPG